MSGTKDREALSILEHSESPAHRGRLADPARAHLVRNPACGDWVRLELRIDAAGRIEAAAFEGGGCLLSQAAASLLCEHVEGLRLAELASFSPADMLRLIDIPLTPRRRNCGLLAFRALKIMVYTHLDRASSARPASPGSGDGSSSAFEPTS